MDNLYLTIRIILSIVAGLLAGWAIPYVFNRTPAKWLCDYDEEPDKEMWESALKNTPGVGFLVFFMGAVFCVWHMGPIYQIAGLPALWLLLLIALADQIRSFQINS